MQANTTPGDWLTLPPRYRIRAARRLRARRLTYAQRVQRGTWLLVALCAALAAAGAAAEWW